MSTSHHPGWLSVKAYCARYDLSRSMLYKLSRFRMVTFKRVAIPGQAKPLVRVEDVPPRESATS